MVSLENYAILDVEMHSNIFSHHQKKKRSEKAITKPKTANPEILMDCSQYVSRVPSHQQLIAALLITMRSSCANMRGFLKQAQCGIAQAFLASEVDESSPKHMSCMRRSGLLQSMYQGGV